MSAARNNGNQREYGKPIVENNGCSEAALRIAFCTRPKEISDGKFPQSKRAFSLCCVGLRYLAIQSSRMPRVWVVATCGQDYSAVTAR